MSVHNPDRPTSRINFARIKKSGGAPTPAPEKGLPTKHNYVAPRHHDDSDLARAAFLLPRVVWKKGFGGAYTLDADVDAVMLQAAGVQTEFLDNKMFVNQRNLPQLIGFYKELKKDPRSMLPRSDADTAKIPQFSMTQLSEKVDATIKTLEDCLSKHRRRPGDTDFPIHSR